MAPFFPFCRRAPRRCGSIALLGEATSCRRTFLFDGILFIYFVQVYYFSLVFLRPDRVLCPLLYCLNRIKPCKQGLIFVKKYLWVLSTLSYEMG